MNWGIYVSGFFIGMVKFLFSHWTVFGIGVSAGVNLSFFEIFLPTYVGAVLSMAIFFFGSDYFMDRAAKKLELKRAKAKADGIVLEEKKKFTKLNRFMVRTKNRFGIYAFTLIAPLLFSIPVGSVVCAKFYGAEKKTFPLMTLFAGIYGLIMTFIIVFVK